MPSPAASVAGRFLQRRCLSPARIKNSPEGTVNGVGLLASDVTSRAVQVAPSRTPRIVPLLGPGSASSVSAVGAMPAASPVRTTWVHSSQRLDPHNSSPVGRGSSPSKDKVPTPDNNRSSPFKIQSTPGKPAGYGERSESKCSLSGSEGFTVVGDCAVFVFEIAVNGVSGIAMEHQYRSQL